MSGWFDSLAEGYDGIVVAGASGWIANHTIEGLARCGIRPLAFADNNRSLWGSELNGVPLMSPEMAAERFPQAVFVAAIFTHTPLRNQLLNLGLRRVVSYAHLFHKFPDAFLPYFAVSYPSAIAREAVQVRKVMDIWADEESRDLYEAIIHWFTSLESDVVPKPLPAAEAYFPPMLTLLKDEVFADCGAYNGDSVQMYVNASAGRYKRIIALEPDPQTFAILSEELRGLDQVTILNAAAGSTSGSLPFVAAGSLASHAVSAGAEGLTIPGEVIFADVVRLDDLEPTPTYVKMDIEGFELEALTGANALLASGRTALAVTLYHHLSDLWALPLYIHEHAPGLRLFLRHYAEDWAETICYAIPPDRVKA